MSTKNNFDKFLYGDDYSIILEKLKDMAGLILERKISLEDIKPDIRLKIKEIKEEVGIVVGIGASYEKKMCTPLKMIEILREITEKFPNEKIYLLGVGKKQDNYANEIISELPLKNITNLVDKLTVFESPGDNVNGFPFQYGDVTPHAITTPVSNSVKTIVIHALIIILFFIIFLFSILIFKLI